MPSRASKAGPSDTGELAAAFAAVIAAAVDFFAVVGFCGNNRVPLKLDAVAARPIHTGTFAAAVAAAVVAAALAAASAAAVVAFFASVAAFFCATAIFERKA